MSSIEERVCVGCGDTEETSQLERCHVCAKHYCADCAYRSVGRRFCSTDCARAYMYEAMDDDEELELDD